MMNEETALLDPIFPGEILFEEFIRPLGIHIKTLSDELSISEPKIKDIIRGEAPIIADIALKLGQYFGTSPDLWLGLQADYESRLAKRPVYQESCVSG